MDTNGPDFEEIEASIDGMIDALDIIILELRKLPDEAYEGFGAMHMGVVPDLEMRLEQAETADDFPDTFPAEWLEPKPDPQKRIYSSEEFTPLEDGVPPDLWLDWLEPDDHPFNWDDLVDNGWFSA